MTDITIPTVALEAAARAIYDILEGAVANQDYGRQMRQWEQAQELARAACLAMLKAWPGMRYSHNETGTNEDWAQWFGLPWHRAEASDGLILPLTTENTNDKA